MERPAQFGTRPLLPDKELAARAKGVSFGRQGG